MQITCNTSSAYHVQHVVLRAFHVSRSLVCRLLPVAQSTDNLPCGQEDQATDHTLQGCPLQKRVCPAANQQKTMKALLQPAGDGENDNLLRQMRIVYVAKRPKETTPPPQKKKQTKTKTKNKNKNKTTNRGKKRLEPRLPALGFPDALHSR